jgi:YfiH family protein
MMFGTLMIDGVECGQVWRDGQLMMGFGNKNLTLESLKAHYPDLQFATLNQVHSATVFEVNEASMDRKSGDGHISIKKDLALVLKTADCLPVLFYDSMHTFVAACHAGWRGLVAGVIEKTVEKCKTHSDLDKLRVVIGPGIKKENYEVSGDVASQITEKQIAATEKRHIDLPEIAIRKLVAAGIDRRGIIVDPRDTFTDSDLPSHRENQTKKRMLSWIAILSK